MHEVGGVSHEQMLGQKAVMPISEVSVHAEHIKCQGLFTVPP